MTTQTHVHTHARRQAVQILYQHELTGCSLKKLVEAGFGSVPAFEGTANSRGGSASGGATKDVAGPGNGAAGSKDAAKGAKVANTSKGAAKGAKILALAIPVYPEGIDDNDLMGSPLSDYACSLVMGVADKLQEIDADIIKTAENWTLERMPIVDRNIIRVAVYEVAYAPDIPTGVAINEAVEMAKLYGAADSPKFVNGILGRIATLYDDAGDGADDAGNDGGNEGAGTEGGAGKSGATEDGANKDGAESNSNSEGDNIKEQGSE